MTSIKDCCEGWVDLMLNGQTKAGRLVSNSCNAAGYYFLSYDTPICKYGNGKFYLANHKYSKTTSKQQNYLRRHIPSEMLVEVDEVEDEGQFQSRM